MRSINLAVWHCSANKPDEDRSIADIDHAHRNRKYPFRKGGYHIYIRRNGTLEFGPEYGRMVWEIGAHAKGFNRNSIGICYEGGLDENGKPADTRTPAQRQAMKYVKQMLNFCFPGIEHTGHRDLSVDLNGDGVISKSEWMRSCPCYDVKSES